MADDSAPPGSEFIYGEINQLVNSWLARDVDLTYAAFGLMGGAIQLLVRYGLIAGMSLDEMIKKIPSDAEGLIRKTYEILTTERGN